MHIYRCLSQTGEVVYGTALTQGKIRRVTGDVLTRPVKTDEVIAVEKLLPPVAPAAIICIGLNYREHARETNMKIPEYPVVFMKNPAAVIGHEADIRLPDSCRDPLQVDYEVELGVVIGKTALNVSEADALSHVAGYTIANDVSARTWQMKAGGHQWVRGKSFDTFCPVGPALVTRDEIPDPNQLAIQCRLNGQIMQQGHTSDMIFSVSQLIAYLSQDTTLLPGTLILTGTPSGVGFMRNPPIFLKPGDVLELDIEQLGTLRNRVL